MVLNAEEVLLPKPWMVASTDGCGEELLRRRMLAGSAKVLAPTCRNKTNAIAAQIEKPVACSGGGEVEGIRARKGVTK